MHRSKIGKHCNRSKRRNMLLPGVNIAWYPGCKRYAITKTFLQNNRLRAPIACIQCHNSYYLNVMMTGSVSRFWEVASRDKDTFELLLNPWSQAGLSSSIDVSVAEKLAVLLFTLSMNSIPTMQVRFQHSGKLICCFIHLFPVKITTVIETLQSHVRNTTFYCCSGQLKLGFIKIVIRRSMKFIDNHFPGSLFMTLKRYFIVPF